MRSLGLLLAACSICCSAIHADTFTVTTTASLGAGSLYEAIAAANAHPGLDTIAFDLPGSGIRTIKVGNNGLPEITDEVIIDGYMQPGAKANTLEVGDNAVILVRIDGYFSAPAMPHNGFVISAGNSVVRGLALIGFPNLFNGETSEFLFDGTAVVLEKKGGNVIKGNFIGATSGTGIDANSTGVSIASSSNIIGGTLPADRNVISLNDTGVFIETGAKGNVVEGNYFGTDPSGKKPLGNATAILVAGTENQIGGTGAAANVISDNQDGVLIAGSGSRNYVQGNAMGIDARGRHSLPNNCGVFISGSNNLIGGLERPPVTGSWQPLSASKWRRPTATIPRLAIPFSPTASPRM
jgi:hypothetical protein